MIFLETRIIDLTDMLPLTVYVYLHSHFSGWLRKTILFLQ